MLESVVDVVDIGASQDNPKGLVIFSHLFMNYSWTKINNHIVNIDDNNRNNIYLSLNLL